MAKKQNLDF